MRTPTRHERLGGTGPSDELCDVLFASLRRSDQRVRARDYVRGILAANGRKSIRNVATRAGGTVTEQSLHHFISSSTWDWKPVRAALAGHVERELATAAYVVRPLFIPKAGEHSVGVARQNLPGHPQPLSGQMAFGAWAATAAGSVPVHWRLHLPPEWLADGGRRQRAEIPEDARPETLDQCAASTALVLRRDTGRGPRHPVVLDVETSNPAGVTRAFHTARTPLLLRVGGDVLLTVTDPAMPGYRDRTFRAARVLASARALRRPVERDGRLGAARERGGLAVGVRVRLDAAAGRPAAGRRGAAQPDLMLVGEWREAGADPAEFWLASDASLPLGEVLRLAGLSRRVAREELLTGERAGFRDYEGRAFRGWHRHMTLASAAHTVLALGKRRDAGHPLRL